MSCNVDGFTKTGRMTKRIGLRAWNFVPIARDSDMLVISGLSTVVRVVLT